MDADNADLRLQLSNAQGYLLTLVQAKLADDTDRLNAVFEMIPTDLWPTIATVAVAELTHEISEHRGALADAWIVERLRVGLDSF